MATNLLVAFDLLQPPACRPLKAQGAGNQKITASVNFPGQTQALSIIKSVLQSKATWGNIAHKVSL